MFVHISSNDLMAGALTNIASVYCVKNIVPSIRQKKNKCRMRRPPMQKQMEGLRG